MSKNRVVVIPCSGIGKALGSVSREAAYELCEDLTTRSHSVGRPLEAGTRRRASAGAGAKQSCSDDRRLQADVRRKAGEAQ